MVNVMDTLRENSPYPCTISFALEDESLSDHELARALQANEHVRALHINTKGTRDCTWDSLLRLIATREMLHEVGMGDYDDDVPQDPQVQTTSTDKFLQAIQMNSAIQTVLLCNIRVSGESVASFLDAATSVTSFYLGGIRMEEHEQERGAHEIAAALQRSTNIRTLKLGHLSDIFLLPILSGLTTNTHVEALYLWEGLSFAASSSMGSLLENTESIVKFMLSNNAESFRPLAQGLINSESVTDVTFHECSFDDEGSANELESILRSKSNFRDLAISACDVRELPATLFANILRPDSPLISLEICCSAVEGFTALLSLLEKSKVERLDMGCVYGPQQFLALTLSIPKMQITELLFDMSEVDIVQWSSAVVRAVKKNASLRSVCCFEFNHNQRRKLNSYFTRNEGLSQWIAAPAMIPKGAWPMAIEAARGIGPDAVFRILSVLGSSVGPVEGKRSRKRPLVFSPKW
jgi:hypothetical protein